jgi:hypothetical protein
MADRPDDEIRQPPATANPAGSPKILREGPRMADRPDTDAALVRRVLGYVITEDGSSQAAREALDRLEARLSEYEQALRLADDLLRRLGEWDVMNLTPLGGHSDVPFWQGEIARVRAALSGSAGGEGYEPPQTIRVLPEQGPPGCPTGHTGAAGSAGNEWIMEPKAP